MFFTGDLDSQNLEQLSLILSLSLQISQVFSEMSKMQDQSHLWDL